MHNVHTAHIFIVHYSVIYTNTFNILAILYNGHIILLMSHLHVLIPNIQHIVNLCFTTGDFPISCKSSILIPLIK